MVTRVAKCTDTIFKDCVRAVLGITSDSLEDLQSGMDIIRHAHLHADIYDIKELQEMRDARTAVDDMYLNKITQLPTKSLIEIIIVHEEGKIKRAKRTVETILSEMARRELFGDTNESDLKENDGEADGPKHKSKLNSKKATSKRSKTTKS